MGCSSVEQDFSRTGGQNAEAWWEGQPASNGSSRYVTDLLSTAATPVLSVPMPNDAELYGPYANTSIAVALIVCYPTDANNPVRRTTRCRPARRSRTCSAADSRRSSAARGRAGR